MAAGQIERDHQLARLGGRHPRFVGHAPHAPPRHHERVPALAEAGTRSIAREHAAEHRVVPVHREPVLGLEAVGLVGEGAPDGIGDRPQRELPVGPLASQALGRRDRAAQAQVDARRRRQQRERARAPVGVARPRDLAARRLQVEHEVDGPLDGRPHRLEEAEVIAEQEVVPHGGGHVRGEVGVARGVLHRAVAVVEGPGALGQLVGDHPLVGPLGLVVPPAGGERHRRLEVVPRVGVSVAEPRDAPVAPLDLCDGVDSAGELPRRERHGLSR